MPYALLAGSLPPERTGVYMGIFDFLIVAPEIIASLAFGWAMNHLLRQKPPRGSGLRRGVSRISRPC
jgi:maltose/moltooligosaccharide transporter